MVITHGFSLSGTLADWMFDLADAIRDRLGTGRIVVYDPGSGALLPCAHPACDDPPGTSGPVLVVMDWAEQSNDLGSGFSEAAAEALFADLVEWSLADADPRVDLARLHLVGHSRGAVVNGEVAERLIAAGLPAPAQMTTLDPHDTGGNRSAQASGVELAIYGAVRGGLDDLDVNQEHPEYSDRGVVSWSGLGYHDNFWRTGCLPGFLDPDGIFLDGAMNFDMTTVGDGQGNDICHSDVHGWYALTVSGGPAPAGWFNPGIVGCAVSGRDAPLDQTVDGFNSSELGGTVPPCPTDPPNQQTVLFDFTLREGLVNGAFERVGSGSSDAGWSYAGGGGTATVGSGEMMLDTGDFREHGRFYVPPDHLLRVCYRVEDPGDGDGSLAVSSCAAATPLGSCIDRQMLTLPIEEASASRCVEASFLAEEQGRGARLRIELPGRRGPSTVDVRVEEVGFLATLFADGFESGDSSAWSVATP